MRPVTRTRRGSTTPSRRRRGPPVIRETSKPLGRPKGPERRPYRWRQPIWSDDQILAALKTAATMSYPLTAGDYDRLRKQRMVSGPTSLVVHKRFGSWTRACATAEVPCGTRGRHRGNSRWTNDELIAFLWNYLETGRQGVVEYGAWARTNEAPSPGLLRLRFGSWSAAVQQARESLRERPPRAS